MAEVPSIAGMKLLVLITLFFSILLSARAGNVIFIHPDGAGIAHWQAARFFFRGPDGELNWDRLPHIAVYRGHMKDNLTATSNGGATVHAFGVKVPAAAFGSDGVSAQPPIAAGGKTESLMTEAKSQGFKIGIINSGSIIEPGTAAFLSSVADRKLNAQIARQIIESGADVILSGGEEWFLPENQTGRHGKSGSRKDGRDLVARARELGYTIVYDRRELAAVPPETTRLLGIFAAAHTFNDQIQSDLDARGLPYYVPDAPTLAEMTAKTLELFAGKKFFLVVEEEGSDNFGNYNNARGVLESLARADEAFGVALSHVEKNSDTLLITAADSEAGGMDVIGLDGSEIQNAIADNGRDKNGAPYSLYEKGYPFQSAPDQFGKRHPFLITWATLQDTSGGIVVRASGLNAEKVRGSFDNTRIYRLMRETLFDSKTTP